MNLIVYYKNRIPRIAVTSPVWLSYLPAFLPSSKIWQRINIIRISLLLFGKYLLERLFFVHIGSEEGQEFFSDICVLLDIRKSGLLLHGAPGADKKYTVLTRCNNSKDELLVSKVAAYESGNQLIYSENDASLFLTTLKPSTFSFPNWSMSKISKPDSHVSVPVIHSHFYILSDLKPNNIANVVREITSELHNSLLVQSPIDDYLSYLVQTKKIRSCTAPELLGPIISKIHELYHDRIISLSICHGDFTPWNLKRIRTPNIVPNIYLYDWEKWDKTCSIGFDFLHFYLQPLLTSSRFIATSSLIGYVRSEWQGSITYSSYDFSLYFSLYILRRYIQFMCTFSAIDKLPFWQAKRQKKFLDESLDLLPLSC